MPLDTVASNSSSNSSGYASATTTPTNAAPTGNSSSHSQYSESHSTTPVVTVEPTPMPTIAAVTPYYNETFQQQHQHQQQLQQHYSHLQQHHPSHSYQLADQLLPPSAPQHNSTYDSYAFLTGGDNPQPTSIERNLLDLRHPTAFYTELEKPGKTPTQPDPQHHNKTANSNNINHVYSSEGGLNNPKLSSEASTSVKPQATATPFYAQPPQTNSSTACLDPYKNKLSAKLPNHNIDYANYSNRPLDATNSAPNAHNFQQYYSGNTLQDAVHGTGSSQMKVGLGVPFSNAAMTVGVNVGSTTSNSSNVGATYPDKYLYSVVPTAAQSPFYTSTQPANISAVPPQYANEIPNDTYHKTSTSQSWHWNMEYGNGNYRSQPRHLSGIPTATIPPTNASYVSPNTAVAAGREIYYTPEKYSSKYDKYNNYYNPHQHYMATNVAGHNVWPNSPNSTPHLLPTLGDRFPHSYSHHTSLPPTGVRTAIAPPPTHPSLAYHHPFPPSAASVNDRQNCCSQPYQQQNCYYPRTAHHPHLIPNTYNPHTQTTPYGTTGIASGSSYNITTDKYGMLDYGHGTKAKVNTNGLYATTTPTYDTSNMNHHPYPIGVTHNQQYANPVTPATVVSHQPLNPNITPHSEISTVYYNDLSKQTAYNTYMSPVQTPMLLQRRESLVQRVEHLPNLPPPYIQPTSVKSSLIDYRKLPEIADEDCFMAKTTLTDLHEQMATNMSPYAINFGLESGMPPGNGNMYSQTATEVSIDTTDTPITPTTKIYSSLRDFLSTWNEDEEDYGFTDERKLSENDSPQFVGQTMSTEGKTNLAEISNKIACETELPGVAGTPVSISPDSTKISRTPQQPSFENDMQLKGASNTQVDINVGRSKEVEINQYVGINLPDIVIDIEKSSGSAPALPSTAKVFAADMNIQSENNDAHYNNFDVEKELDELETKRPQLSRKISNMAPPRTGSVIMKAETETQEMQTDTMPHRFIEDEKDRLESIKTPESFEIISPSSYTVSTEKLQENVTFSVNKSELTLSTVQTKPDVSYDRGIESDNTTSSNGSTFEKEYETFINKIENDFDLKVAVSKDSNIGTINMANKQTDSVSISSDVKTIEEELLNGMNKTFAKRNSQTDIDIAQKIKSFSKFYKRKRKYSDPIKYEDDNKIRNQGQVLVNDANFPMVYTKRCRKRKEKNIHLKPKTYSFYQRTLRSLRRQLIIRGKRLATTLLKQQHIASVRDSHLPLIKRKVTKQFSSGAENEFKSFNPKTLKCLIICFINSELFRSKLLNITHFKKAITEPKTMNTAPKKEIEISIKMLKSTSDIPTPNQTHANENNEECKKSSDIFEETSVNEQLLNEAKTAENCSNPASFMEVGRKRDADVENRTGINVIVTNKSEMHSDKSNNIEGNFIDSPEDMEKTTSEEIKKHSLNDINSLQHLIAENLPSKDVGIKGIECKRIEIFTNSPPKLKCIDRLVNDVGAETKDFIDSTKVLDGPPYELTSSQNMEVLKKQFCEIEKVGEKGTGTSSFNTDNANRVSQTELQLKQLSEDLTDTFSTHSQPIKRLEIGSAAEKFEDAEYEITNLENSNKKTCVNLKKIGNSSVGMAVDNFENRELTFDPLKYEEFRLNSTGENVYRFSEDHLHSERINNSRTEMNIEIKDEQAVRVDLPEITKNYELSDQQSEGARLINLDVCGTEKSFDMLGGKKSVEYFPESPRYYFEKSVDFDDKSPDCNSSSSSDSLTTPCDQLSKALSSSSFCFSSDGDTQSSTRTTHSDFNEMKELEKELSQHQTSESSNIQATTKKKNIAADMYTKDDSGDRIYNVPVKTIRENDIKALKQILESDSDEHEQVETIIKKTYENAYEDEIYERPKIGTRVLEDTKDHDRYEAVEDSEVMEAEESAIFDDESNLEMPMNVKEPTGYELRNVCVETSGVERCDKSSEIECLKTSLEIDENQSQKKYLFNASLEASNENRVPSLKQILLDFFERKNSIEDHSRIHRTEDELNSRIPKLSDLCKIALRSSFEIKATINTNQNVPEKLEHELSVEEALAEMYRQAGVASDPEDGDTDEKDTQDVVLINLEEILVSDSDLYVLECDMNENVLSVVAHAQTADLPMAVDYNEDNVAVKNENDEAAKDVAQLENSLQEVKLTNETTDLFGPYLNIDGGVPHSLNEAAMPYTTLSRTLTNDSVEDAIMVDNENPFHIDSFDTQFDFPDIHHEEIVSHDYRRLKRQVLYSSLREKYVLKRVNFSPHFGNRVLKKYIHRWILQCLIARFRERELKKVQI